MLFSLQCWMESLRSLIQRSLSFSELAARTTLESALKYRVNVKALSASPSSETLKRGSH